MSIAAKLIPLKLISITTIISVGFCLGAVSSAHAVPETFIKVRKLILQQNSSLDKSSDIVKALEEILKNEKSEASDKSLAQLGLGYFAYRNEDYKKAQEYLEATIKAKSELEDYARFHLALTYKKTGQTKLAEQEFNRTLNLKPNLQIQNDSLYEISSMLLEQGRYKEARAVLVKLEKKSRGTEKYPLALLEQLRIERHVGNNASICKVARKLYTRYPALPDLKDWGVDLNKNQIDGKAIPCSASSEDQRRRIKNLQWNGMADRAKSEITFLRDRLGKSDKYESDRLLAQFLISDGEVEEALKILVPYYATKKTDYNYLMAMATASARAGEYQTAVGSYYAAYRLTPKSQNGKKALFQAAFMSYQFQDYDGASRRFNEFIKAYKGSGLVKDAKWHLAWIRYLKGDYVNSVKSMADLRLTSRRGKKVVSTFANDRITYWMAMGLLKQGKNEQARHLFASLSKDNLMGYYAILSQNRLKSLPAALTESQILKLGKTTAVKTAPTYVARYPQYEKMQPWDDIRTPISEEYESEETLSLNNEDDDTVEVAEESNVTEASDGVAGSDADAQAPVAQQEEANADDDRISSFKNPLMNRRFERAKALTALGFDEWAKWELFEIERKTSNRDYLKNLISEYENVGSYHRASYIGQTVFGAQRAKLGIEGARAIWESTYPRAYREFVNKYAKQFDIPQELIWGIMRAESNYKREAMSPVGALGLMQVMPGTGNRVSQMMGDKSFEARRLLEPETAIKIGGRYLQRLMAKFENNIPLVAASYNAGPHRAGTWLASFGMLDMDEFVEHIPFLETRNYVKKVISNYYIYSNLYNPKKDLFAYLVQPVGIKSADPVSTKETWDDI